MDKAEVVRNAEEIGEADVEAVSKGIQHITVVPMECVLVQAKTEVHQQKDTRKIRCVAKRCW